MKKLLVANRGEIAIRAFRAAYQLDIDTVAIHTFEDRNSLHRLKADEAYEIGEHGHPVRAYLDPIAIVAAAKQSGADAVYPGYGFLSESPDFAEAVIEAGLTFVGPSVEVLKVTGNKQRARDAAEAAGLPVLQQSPALTPESDLVALSETIGFPLFVKAAAGGGGRGMRRVEHPSGLVEAVDAAMREALSAFGDDTVFLEEAITDVRHIEVQVLGDNAGNIIHLYERDCSVQRRFQKVVEIAPAPDLTAAQQQALTSDAVTFAHHINYVNAGTVEFLVDTSGRHVFIEMNPRIQVEHTVTEEVTDVDLVEAQLRIAAGDTLADLGLDQASIVLRGFALQCRITAEDPANDFRPDTGRLLAYRTPGGAGVRLDGSGGFVGHEITPYFDSLIVKLTCRGRSFDDAVRRAERSLAEFRVRGIATNLAFLQAVLGNDDFRSGGVTTTFIDERPELTAASVGADRSTRLLRYLGDITVNRPHGSAPTELDPHTKLPPVTGTPADGSKQLLDRLGPAGFASALRNQSALAVTDTTLRDAHQSILATRVRSIDLTRGAEAIAHATPGLLSLECWGGATFDVALRFLHEDPWKRLEALREAAPNLCLQMLIRGRNAVGYSPYPDVVARTFVAEAHRTGIDIFRVFDAFNDIEQMRPAIEAAIEVGAVAEGTLCYSGNMTDPGEDLYTLDYYLGVAEKLVDAGAHILCVKGMAGLLRAPAASILISALRDRFDTPVHLHSHDTSGGQLATYAAAAQAGVDAVDGAAPPLSGLTSQPSLSAIIAATEHTERDTGLSLDAVGELEPYWEAVRALYKPFEAGLTSPTGTVYKHEIPGGQLSNLRQQAIALGLGDRFEEVEHLYATCNVLLGRPIKVTPSSKVVGDLALHLVASGVTPAQLENDPESVDLPESVIKFLHGELGTPPAGFPEPFRTKALVGRPYTPTPAELDPIDEQALQGDDVRKVLNRLLLPGPAASQEEQAARYGNLAVLPSRIFWYGLDINQGDRSVELRPGVNVLVGLEAVGEPNDDGIRSVVFRLNGQFRPIDIRDRHVASNVITSEKAKLHTPGHVAAPFRGVVSVSVAPGDTVEAGDSVAVIEAMKMESAISAGVSGTVSRVVVPLAAAVEPGDLLVEIRPAGLAEEI
ncbi:MAG: pyruvate carboxylase [Acidimicrobiaceae bacterium]|nr:pyruvate carboxylase [Acidimicrobiaceae bacterium]